MEPLYNVYFAGDVIEGQDPASARAGLARLFKANEETLDRLFSGKMQLLKRDCDKATALKYKQAMEQAGVRALIKSSEANAITSPPPAAEKVLSAAERIAALAAAPDAGEYAAAADEEQPTAQAMAEGIDLAATGSDVLKPEERSAPVSADIDTGTLDIDAHAQRLSEEPAPPPPSPDTDHLSMGEVGEDIPQLDSGVEALSPNTDALSLSPEGTDFSDCAPPEPTPPAVDLSEINLAPEGSDVLEEEYRHKDKAAAPETDHISLKS